MFTRKTPVYWFLLAAWILVMAWQGFEHRRVTRLAREASVRRAIDIGRTLELVIRSQGFVYRPRLDAALHELLKSDELKAIALLNANGEAVAAAGEPFTFQGKGLPQHSVVWEHNVVTVINLVDLGTPQQEGQPNTPTIVADRRDIRPRFSPREPRPGEGVTTNQPPPPPPQMETNPPPVDGVPGMPPPRGEGPGMGEGRERRPNHRPPWMSKDDYDSLIQKNGFHALAISISAQAYQTAWMRDLWLRTIIGLFATLSAVGIGFSWRNLAKSSELQMRLLRASEMNTHLREMNVAAAGLAHETRNPLNIIRGVAQLISKDATAGEPVRQKSLEIMDEVDYVTVRLNEFINYSRPRELRRSPVDLAGAVNDVVRSLNSDVEDKKITLDLKLDTFTANADQQMLRQILFNLLINAVQAVEPGGQIQVVARKNGANEGFFEIRDNGHGVSPEHRQEIFRPYFTTRQDGTGLGLAVVKQIVSLHGWEVECQPNGERGSVFRVSRIEALATPAS